MNTSGWRHVMRVSQKWMLSFCTLHFLPLKRSTIICGPLSFGGDIHSICVTTFTHPGGKLPALSGTRNRRSLSAWSRLQCNQFLDLAVMTQQIQQYLVCLCQVGMLYGTYSKPQYKTQGKKPWSLTTNPGTTQQTITLVLKSIVCIVIRPCWRLNDWKWDRK